MSDTRPADAATGTTASTAGGGTNHLPVGAGPAAAVPPDTAAALPEPDLSADHLPCGRSTDELLDLVLDGRASSPHDERDAHQRTCVHCRALAAEADRLWEPVRVSAATVQPPPPDLLATVMAAVRALGHAPEHLVIPGSRGATHITADVIRQIAERAAGDVPDVALALARRAHPAPVQAPTQVPAQAPGQVPGQDPAADQDAGSSSDPEDSSGVGVAGSHTVIDLAVVTVYGAAIPRVAAEVRDHVRRALRAMTTATDVHIDIYVDDITTDPATTAAL